DAVLKCLLGNAVCRIVITTRNEALYQASTAHAKPCLGKAMRQVLKPVPHQTLLASRFLGKAVGSPVAVQCLRGGNDSQIVAAEGTAMRTRLPYIELRLHQHERHGQAKS